ncbi:MAG: aldo/keto reductase [Micrococcales bacterium 73-15]|uniref:aldo/keto reductase n=1 Tax=Salana multivorans TaxID=120377 RepID=UPI00096429E6|nr:aldo/keto reductase [Salana multivorans]OJX95416.1 MAG: aldo/keto reductase [Micrococcales bacterium 73-15]
MTTVTTVPLGTTGIRVPNVVLGLMRIESMSDEAVRELVETGLDAGIDMVDHADIYGSELHACEARFAEAMQLTPAQREALTIQSKAGIVKDGPYFDFSFDHLVSSVEASLRALRTDYLDVLLLHRPDALVEPDEVARAFDHLESTGKVRAFGVSNHTPGQIELLRRSVRQPIVANQVQLSITHSPLIAQGVAANMAGEDQSIVRDGGGLVDYCRLHDITLQAWSPFQAGFFNGVFLGNPDYAELNAVVDRLAGAYGVDPIAIATAWITRHPAGIQVILGTTNPDRVRAAADGSDIPLTRAEWYELFRAAGHIVP